MDDLLAKLREFDALRDISHDGHSDSVYTREMRCQSPDFAPSDYIDKFPIPIRNALYNQGIKRFYTHQAEAINCISSGQDVVLEAPTASGKTLCFNIPIVLSFMNNPLSHALMIHPMKALSNDQRRQFEDLAAPLNGKSIHNIESWIFDGDLDIEHRRLIKSHPPAVLFTNPEMLHQSFLGWGEQWHKFLSSLKMVIIDEIHEYRGYFGTNVALLLRRFFAKLSQYNIHPQVVLATATCGNAEEHAYRLTERPCKLIRAATAMQPERHFAFINPSIPDFRFNEIYRLRIARAALACIAQGLSTLIFCPSRKFAEAAAMQAKSDAVQFGIDANIIAPYRSGYESNLRRQIENGLRSGDYKAVFSTNALEIGIDIGRLDACILAGFPDSVLSAWQRIGRVGRNWDKRAFILFYAFNNPFDRFFASNIDAFLNKPLDEILIGVDNEELMEKHLPYVVHECGTLLERQLSKHLGTPFFRFVNNKMEGKKPVQGHAPNYQRLSIRGTSSTTFRLSYKGNEIGTISDVHLFREAYVGAIYNHFGIPYRVIAHAADEVILDDVEPYFRTDGIFYTLTQSAEILSGYRYDENLITCYGKLRIFENFAGFRLIDTRTGEIVDEERSQLGRTSNVRGFWIEIMDFSVLNSSCNIEDVFGFEQLLRIGAPFVVPCDRHDLCTLTNLKTPATIYLYETVPGGIGVAEKTLDVWTNIVETAINIAERCNCKNGCPSCIVPSRLPQGFDEPKKSTALKLGREFINIAKTFKKEKYNLDSHTWSE